MPFILAVSGFKNSGKTTLCRKLITLLLEEGVDAAYVKHTHENVLSPSGSDTGSIAATGSPTALWGPDGIRVEESDRSIGPGSIAARFFPGKELVIIEGGKGFALPKIWVGSPLDVPEDVTGVVAFYDRERPCAKERHFSAGDERALAALAAEMARKAESSPAELYCGDKRIPAKAFVGAFISGSVKGMLGALKGDFDTRRGIRLYLRRER
jgi:molybdopterin-guanine dinucleotide biosynthesis protein B